MIINITRENKKICIIYNTILNFYYGLFKIIHYIIYISSYYRAALAPFFGQVAYAFKGVGMVLDIKEQLQDQKVFLKLIRAVFIVITSIYIAYPSICYFGIPH